MYVSFVDDSYNFLGFELLVEALVESLDGFRLNGFLVFPFIEVPNDFQNPDRSRIFQRVL